MTRDTVGKISSDLIIKEPDTSSPIEQMQESLTDYDKNIEACIESGRKTYPRDFFVVVITKKEPLMQNVLRHYFLHRSTCPTPQFDQAVYKYTRASEAIDFIWVVPAKDVCELLRDNAPRVHESEYQLLKFVLELYDGTLLRKCLMLNGEIPDTFNIVKE